MELVSEKTKRLLGAFSGGRIETDILAQLFGGWLKRLASLSGGCDYTQHHSGLNQGVGVHDEGRSYQRE
jgi:hypothetical protein